MATQDVACGARLWKTGGQLRATLICKATFAVVESGPMRVVAPAGLAIVDEHSAGDPTRSCVVSSDLVPYRPRGEVFFVGHAHAPNGRPCASLTARLAVVGQRPLIEKSIHVFGERVILNDGQSSQPVPFTRMPMVYERTIFGAEENPVGMQAESGAPAPNLVDPQDPASPIGFGPIGSQWPVRKRMLRQLDPAVVGASIPEIPDAFAWSYFQAAPADQRCAFFEGNEWLILDGLHPDKPHFETQLPTARAAARLYMVPPGGTIADGTHRDFQLVADTLFVDGDRGLVCMVWRGNLDVDAASVPNLQVLAGLELPGRTIPWPASKPAQSSPMGPGAVADSVSPAAASVRAVPVSAPPAQAAAPSAPVPAPTPAPTPAPPTPPAPSPAPATPSEPPDGLDPSTDDGGVRTMYRPADAALLARAAAPDAPLDPERQSAPPATDVEPPLDVEPEWLEKPNEHDQSTRIVPNILGATLSVADIEKLAQSMQQGDGHPTTMRRPRFDDPETFQPDSTSIAQIVRDAEASLHAGGRSSPVPPAPVRQMTPSPMNRLPLQRSMTPGPMMAGAGPEADRVAAMARAKAVEAAELGAAAAREHIAAGGMRKARPPKTTIRGLHDPNRALAEAQAEQAPAETARPDVADFHDLFQESTAAGASAAAKIAAEMRSPSTTRNIQPETLAEAMAIVASNERRTSPPPAADDPLGSLEDAEDRGDSTKISAGVTAQLAALTAQKTGGSVESPIAPIAAIPDVRDEVIRRIGSGETLAGMPLEGVDLSGLDLTRQNLSGARLRGAGLRGTKLDGADLSATVLDEADLTHASLEGANLERASLRAAILNDAVVKSAMVTDADFEGAIGTSASFDAATGERVRFVGGRFDCAKFNGASLPGADFSEAILDGASFDQADLTEARFYEVRGEGSSFTRAKLVGARLDSSVLSRGRFQSIDAADSNWDQAELDQATFLDAKLAGASFAKASCRETTFSNADLADARFIRAVLRAAHFENVDTSTVNFDGADMQGAVLPTTI